MKSDSREKIAFNIGQDAGVYGIEFFEDWPIDLREGWAVSRKRHPQPKASDRFIKKWVQLRVGAYKRDKYFADDVTPNYLKMINLGFCPVILQDFTYSKNMNTDWSIDRVNNSRGYERRNLISLSTKANSAKSDLSYSEIGEKVARGRAITNLAIDETVALWSVISPFFRNENDDIEKLNDYYHGQIVVPDVPMNWVMSLQLMLSLSIAGEGISGLQTVLRIFSKCSGNKRLLAKLMKRLCKFSCREPAVPFTRFPEWRNEGNRKNLRRWLRSIRPQYREHLRELATSIASENAQIVLESNLEKWEID